MKRIVLFSLPIVMAVSGCARAPFRTGGGTSVEDVLRKTSDIQITLDEEYGYRLAGEKEEVFSSKRSRWDGLPFRWPIRNIQVNSRFGRRGGRAHTGTDLQARTGTPIKASLGGIVVFADDRISGYGDTVMIRHVRGISTLYAHCSDLLVREGDWVIQGQRIALSGESGRASGPHVHFELRDGLEAVDPERVLAAARIAEAAAESQRSSTTLETDVGEP